MKELKLLGLDLETNKTIELLRFAVNVKGDDFIIPFDIPINKPIAGISLTEIKEKEE